MYVNCTTLLVAIPKFGKFAGLMRERPKRCKLNLYYGDNKLETKLTKDELKLMSKLRRKGIPLDGEVLLDLESRSRGPSIYQTGSAAENTVFDLDFGGSGYMLSLAIDNVSDRIIHLREFRLSVPWPEPEFKWLKDPFRKSPREFMYSFPPPRTAGFEREVVLNHCLGPYGRLNPGGALEGLLLGVAKHPSRTSTVRAVPSS